MNIYSSLANHSYEQPSSLISTLISYFASPRDNEFKGIGMNVVSELPYIELPGIAPPSDWQLNHRSLHLTYKGHIPKDEYETWFNKVVITHYCKGGSILFLALAHESADEIHPYKHTHIIVQTMNAPIRSSDPLVLHWRRLPREPIHVSHIPPEVRLLRTPTHIREARYHLSIRDPANAILRSEPIEGIVFKGLPVIVREPLNPLVRVESFMRWQIDVLLTMNTRTESRIIHIVHDSAGGAGKMAFFKALMYNEPSRFVIAYRRPVLTQFIAHLREVKNTTWNGDCVIINARYEEGDDYERVDRIIECLQDIVSEFNCPNVWLFTNVMPKIDNSQAGYKKYKISGNWRERRLSFLQPLS